MPSVEFYETVRDQPSGDVQAVTAQVGVAAALEGLQAEGVVKVLEYRWRLKADNGEIIATGEGHTRQADAERAFLHVAHLLGHMWALARDEIDKTVADDGALVWSWA